MRASLGAIAVALVVTGCAGGGPVSQPLPGPAPATLPDTAPATGAPQVVPSALPSGAAASGAAAFAYEARAYPVPTGTPASDLGLGDTCRALASIEHDTALDDAQSASELRSLATRTSLSKLASALRAVATQYAAREPVLDTARADDLCN